jgi:hypothetical protein
MMVLLASSFGALRLMGVRDWRCYGAAALSITLLSAVMLGSVTPLMLLGAALAWRYRDRWRACALAVASLIALKLILWPLVIWLWFTGRRRAAAASLAGGVLLCVAGWAVIAFHGALGYPRLLSNLASLEADRGYSIVHVAHLLGMGGEVARLAPYIAGAAVLAAIPLVVSRAEGDRRAFTLALFAGLVFSPIVWQQYFALLLVPIAACRQRFAGVWLLPLGYWLAPFNATEGHSIRLLVSGVVTGAILYSLLSGGDGAASPQNEAGPGSQSRACAVRPTS